MSAQLCDDCGQAERAKWIAEEKSRSDAKDGTS